MKHCNTSDKLADLIIFTMYNSYQGEVWREIRDTEGKYFVSSCGRVLSLCQNKPRILRKQTDTGYERVCIKDKYFLVHRLVAQAFNENPDKKPLVHHLDGSKGNNTPINLLWVDSKQHSKLHAEIRKKQQQK